MLEALAADYEVSLLVIPVVAGPPEKEVHPQVARWCARMAVHPVADRVDPLFRLMARIKDPRERLAAYASYPRPSLCRFATPTSIREAAQVFRGVPFQEVHVFRLYLAPFADPWLRADPAVRPTCRLDLDDHESRTRRALAALYEANGDETSALIERSESVKYSAIERQYLPRYDRVYVCSDRDRLEITREYECNNVTVVPNGVRLPLATPPGRSDGPFTFLFVGNLGYYPNEDAALWFCSEVLPRIRADARKTFRVLIVGTNPSHEVLALSAHPEVTVTGEVSNLERYYRDADLVVVPVRAGGGSRIKVIEAFSYRRPVVSTTCGGEGIEVRHGRHLLVADSPGDLAEQCVRLMNAPEVGLDMAGRAFQFVKANHSPERILELLRQDHRTP
jgi:glycosyltransferase involved in cell wall biosynthesis